MSSGKYNNMTFILFVSIFIIALVWISFQLFIFVIKTNAESAISTINERYQLENRLGEKTTITQSLDETDSRALELYYSKIQPIMSKYQALQKFKIKNSKPISNSLPLNFNEFDRSTFSVTTKDLNIKNEITINKRVLQIKGGILDVISPDLQIEGAWGVYLNDDLIYSINLFTNEEKTETIGFNSFKYVFNEDKQLFLRVVYLFKNIKTNEIEYFVHEQTIEIKK